MITMSNLVPKASLGPQCQSDSKMVAAPYLTWAGAGESASIRDGPLFFPGGIVIGKKIVCMRHKKNFFKIVCPRGASGKNCLQRPPNMLCKIWGIFKKLSAQPEWRKKTCKCSIDGGKTFLPPRNHDPPRPPRKIMVRP